MESRLDITIRPFQDDDAHEVSRLIIDNLMQVNILHNGQAAVMELAKSYSPALLKHYASSGQVYVAFERSALVGTVTLERDHVRMVFVRVDRHRQGIGSTMMRYLEEMARQRGLRGLSLLADISAADFYQKLGYSRVEEKQVRVGDSAIRMVVMEKGIMDIIEEQIAAYNSRDLERFLSTYSPDIVIEDGKGNILMQGHDQLRERYGSLFSSSPELHGEIVNRMRIGPYVVDEEQVTGVRGSPTPLHAAAIYRVEDDKIVHVRMLS